MKNRGFARSSIVIAVILLLLLSPLSLFSGAAARAQELAQEVQPDTSADAQATEIIDSTTMGEDIFPGTDAISAEEMTAPSDPYTKTRQNPDGTFTREIFTAPINWQDGDGSWREINSNLVPDEVDGYALANASNFFSFRLAQTSDSGKTCSLEIGDKKAKLHLAGHAKKDYKGDNEEDQKVKDGVPETGEETPATEAPPALDCVAEGNQAYYYDSKKGYSLEFIHFSSTIEQLIKLQSPASPNAFDFKLDTEGMDAEWDELGNIHFLSQEDGSKLFTIYAPLMCDSSRDKETGEPPGAPAWRWT
ncbi:MAG: hypothetical protein AB1384_04415 [Actinomycetota bacterium]